MRKETTFNGINGKLGCGLLYYLSILLCSRLYPDHELHMLAGGLVCWALLPYAESFLRQMTRPIPRAMPKKRERLLIGSALVKPR